jgi:endonuclease-3 related protein
MIRGLDLEVLEDIIRPAGFYHQKASYLKALFNWMNSYDDNLERIKVKAGNELREELLAIKGIGKETADCILTYAFDHPYFVIDAYTRRILQRIGNETPKEYDALRLELESGLPKDLRIFQQFHALIVAHAKRHCTIKPDCENCPIERCQFRNKE